MKPIKIFLQKIQKLKSKINKYLYNSVKKNKIIHGYGASTKGNVLLQYFGINKKIVPVIADRNPEKQIYILPVLQLK